MRDHCIDMALYFDEQGKLRPQGGSRAGYNTGAACCRLH
jgi:hypothetical protein